MGAWCLVVDCPGHPSWLESLVHGQDHVLKALHRIAERLAAIETNQEQIMTDVDQLVTDFTTFKGDVTTALDGLKATVEELKAELAAALANQGGIPPEVQAKLDALDQDVLAADTAVKAAPTPAPGDVPPAA